MAGDIVGHKYKPNPAIAQAGRARLEMLRYAIEFGMTPSSAAKVQAEPAAEREASFADFIGGDMTEDDGERPN